MTIREHASIDPRTSLCDRNSVSNVGRLFVLLMLLVVYRFFLTLYDEDNVNKYYDALLIL